MGNGISSDRSDRARGGEGQKRADATQNHERYQRFVLSLKRNANRLFLSGEVMRVNEVTRNGRIFSTLVMEKAIRDIRLPIYGRLEHPECDVNDPESVKRYKERCRYLESSSVAMDEDVLDGMHASHVVRDLYFNGDAVIVLVEILECTEAGRKVRDVYEKAGGLVGASMRAWSSTEEVLDVDRGCNGSDSSKGGDNPIRVVCEDDFELITIDLVAKPSHALAYLQPHLGKVTA